MANIFSLLRRNRSCRALVTTVLVCLDHDSLLVMWKPRNLVSSLLHYSPVDENGVELNPFYVVHNHLLCLVHVEGEVVILAPHCQVSDLLPIGCLIFVGDQAYHCGVIS